MPRPWFLNAFYLWCLVRPSPDLLLEYYQVKFAPRKNIVFLILPRYGVALKQSYANWRCLYFMMLSPIVIPARHNSDFWRCQSSIILRSLLLARPGGPDWFAGIPPQKTWAQSTFPKHLPQNLRVITFLPFDWGFWVLLYLLQLLAQVPFSRLGLGVQGA